MLDEQGGECNYMLINLIYPPIAAQREVFINAVEIFAMLLF